MNNSMPDEVTVEELRDLVKEAVWLIEIDGTDQERAAFRKRKDDLLARLFPPELES
jgi:hypothetical protein